LSKAASRQPTPSKELLSRSRGANSEAGVDYAWSGQEIRLPAPAVDLEHLQGNWQVSSITPCINTAIKLPDETGLNALTSKIEINDNQLRYEGKVVATLANDLQLKAIQEEVGFRSYRPILLTLSDGKGLMCSYMIKADGVEIAYPHTTSCHRGSGHIVFLKRPE
jgi:hypothetical protein